MTIKKAIQEARSYNHSMIIAKRMGGLPATVAAMRNRRDYFMEFARFYS